MCFPTLPFPATEWATIPIRAPFVRPGKLSTDESTSFQVVNHCLNWLRDNEHYEADWVILLEPTSPTRQSFHIDEVANIIYERSSELDSICGVSKAYGCSSAFKALKANEEQILESYHEGTSFSEIVIRNQLVPPSMYINSVIYAFNVVNTIYDTKPSMWGNKTYGYEVESKYVSDIDTTEDWLIAEAKMKHILDGN